jgi:hypothetical protein
MWGLYGRNTILDAADERLKAAGDEADDRCMEKVLVVGLWCAHPDQSERPSIAQAMHVLQSEDDRLPELTPQMYRTVSEFAVTGRAVGVLGLAPGFKRVGLIYIHHCCIGCLWSLAGFVCIIY